MHILAWAEVEQNKKQWKQKLTEFWWMLSRNINAKVKS
jgi:hypothetical protein